MKTNFIILYNKCIYIFTKHPLDKNASLSYNIKILYDVLRELESNIFNATIYECVEK